MLPLSHTWPPSWALRLHLAWGRGSEGEPAGRAPRRGFAPVDELQVRDSKGTRPASSGRGLPSPLGRKGAPALGFLGGACESATPGFTKPCCSAAQLMGVPLVQRPGSQEAAGPQPHGHGCFSFSLWGGAGPLGRKTALSWPPSLAHLPSPCSKPAPRTRGSTKPDPQSRVHGARWDIRWDGDLRACVGRAALSAQHVLEGHSCIPTHRGRCWHLVGSGHGSSSMP